jgi:hypothetical protein
VPSTGRRLTSGALLNGVGVVAVMMVTIIGISMAGVGPDPEADQAPELVRTIAPTAAAPNPLQTQDGLEDDWLTPTPRTSVPASVTASVGSPAATSSAAPQVATSQRAAPTSPPTSPPTSSADAAAAPPAPAPVAGGASPTAAAPAAPATGDFPGASTSGVPNDVTLKPWTGGRTISKAGQVIDGYVIEGGLEIRADNVTIKNSLVRGQVLAGYGSEQTGLKVIDTTIDGQGKASSESAIGDANYSCIRCDITGFGNGPRMYRNVTVQDSWIHDLCCYTPGDHRSGIGSNGGSNFVVKNNVIDCGIGGCSGALVLYGDNAEIRDVLVERNLLMTVGGFCAYGGSVSDKAFPVAANTRFIDNHFSQRYNATCGGYGPVTSWSNANGNVWSGNRYHESGAPITK